MSAESDWWREQYALGDKAHPHALPFIERWPILTQCAKCDKQLGHDPDIDAHTAHRCRNGAITGGRLQRLTELRKANT